MYSISTRDLPRIHDYQDAEYTYNTIKPIRGNEHIRPLGRRSNHHKRIECNTDKNGRPYYAAILHNTECVSYYEDGTIRLSTGGWASMSTAEFIGAVSPWRCWRQYNFVTVCVSSGEYVVTGPEGLLIKAGVVQNPVAMAVRTFNRAETKRIRTVAKPILDYFRVMRGVIGEDNLNQVCYEMRTGLAYIALDSILRHLTGVGSVSDDQLSMLFATYHGRIDLMYLYASAILAGVTSRGKLYDVAPLPPGVVKKGMFIEDEGTA